MSILIVAVAAVLSGQNYTPPDRLPLFAPVLTRWISHKEDYTAAGGGNSYGYPCWTYDVNLPENEFASEMSANFPRSKGWIISYPDPLWPWSARVILVKHHKVYWCLTSESSPSAAVVVHDQGRRSERREGMHTFVKIWDESRKRSLPTVSPRSNWFRQP